MKWTHIIPYYGNFYFAWLTRWILNFLYTEINDFDNNEVMTLGLLIVGWCISTHYVSFSQYITYIIVFYSTNSRWPLTDHDIYCITPTHQYDLTLKSNLITYVKTHVFLLFLTPFFRTLLFWHKYALWASFVLTISYNHTSPFHEHFFGIKW